MAKKRRKKKKQPETGMDRLKATPLWMWGLICMMGGVFANITNQFTIEAQGLRGAAARGAKFGGGVAALLFIVVGLVLIVVHFTRRK